MYQVFVSVEAKLAESQENGVVLCDGRVPSRQVPLPWSLSKHIHHLVVPGSVRDGGKRS